MMSNELDILIVGDNDERFTVEIRTAFRHWQVYSARAPHALYGRQFRRAYYTGGATTVSGSASLLDALRAHGDVLPFSDYEPGSLIDAQAWEDEAMLREIRRALYTVS